MIQYDGRHSWRLILIMLARSKFLYSVLIISIGLLGGLGAYTFNYAEGLSYLSNDPAACKNCHIMNDQYDSWRKGPHHAVATCNDCHVPRGFFEKYIAKAKNGYHHSKGFTLQDFQEPIRIKPGNSKILEKNCLGCHGDFVHDALTSRVSSTEELNCVHCHRGVGHGARR